MESRPYDKGRKTEPNRPWANLPVQVPGQVQTFFKLAIISVVGSGENTLFWMDRWLNGQSIVDLAPRLLAFVPKRIANRRTVEEAMADRSWVMDIRGGLSVEVILDFLSLWDLIYDFQLQPDIEDSHIWRFSSSGQYSAKSAYENFFIGSTQFGPYERIWKSWAPPKCRFFMWLVAHDWCWTADRLARRGLPHPEQCLLCDQEEEAINHLLVSCVFTRQFWFFLSILVSISFPHSLQIHPLICGGKDQAMLLLG